MRGPPPRKAGLRTRGGSWVPRTWRGRGPVEGPPPRMVPGLGEGTSDSTSWTPCYWGGKRMTPSPSRCLCPLRAATLCCTNPRARPLLCTYRRRRGLRGGAASSLALPFTFFFLHLEERTVFDSALFMFLLGNKRWLCACVFSCVGFFKEMGRRKKLPFPCSLPPPFCPSDTPTPAPFFFCFVLLRVHIPVCNPWFARFSVFSKVSLCQLCSPPPLSPVGALWAGRGLARSPPLSPIPSFLRPSAEEGERERALGTLRSSDERRAPSRRSWALGLLMSRLGGGRWRLQPAFGINEPRVSPLGRSDCRMESRQPQPEAGKKRENFNFLGLCFTVK